MSRGFKKSRIVYTARQYKYSNCYSFIVRIQIKYVYETLYYLKRTGSEQIQSQSCISHKTKVVIFTTYTVCFIMRLIFINTAVASDNCHTQFPWTLKMKNV